MPTYGYELAQAVKDGYLVDFLSVETKMKFLEEGIAYDELSDEDKEAYENTFVDENGQVVERIQSSALNTWIFNDDTIQTGAGHSDDTWNPYRLRRKARQDDYFCEKSCSCGKNI